FQAGRAGVLSGYRRHPGPKLRLGRLKGRVVIEPAAPGSGRLHHSEIWVRDLDASRATWLRGTSYVGARDYIVLESGPDVFDEPHRRRSPGLNHLAFVAGSRRCVYHLGAEALAHGFTLLFGQVSPYAGGPGHYAIYLQDDAGFEVELVADGPGGADRETFRS
ncbi:MAG: hypothetical protein Q4P23_13365, partial [Micrococcaceae bacterium]|nr:hypothetical protein [Micrococcaceae bacterium]